ncbi:hypothetical protein HUG20_11945 [Salicibibacter cibi]|uniref:AMP-dependent synthetase/ligase domain-containing protein n=1 Tax=Salicibibacter cibi TaxID=2743001 RepID=A0A7T7CFU8_9BACI|nr:hypothetical protein [Salicibibacter cibi]QQK80540.1 hypothetical protein HUG20_11945 [Salicibibacter cibi]
MGLKEESSRSYVSELPPVFLLVILTVLSLDAVVVQVNPMYKPPELLHVLNDSVSVIIMLDDIKPVFQAIKNKSGVKTVIEVSLKVPSDFDALLNDECEAPRTAIDPKVRKT